MTSSLPRSELVLYFILWTGGVVYSIYNVYSTGRKYYDLNRPGDEFTPGWSWLGGALQDQSDYELESWFEFLYILGPWLVIHLSVSLLIEKILQEALCSWYILVSVLFLWEYIGISLSVFVLLQPCVFYMLRWIGNRSLVWGASLLFLISMMYFNYFLTSEKVSDQQSYMLEMAMYWTHLRCLSLSLDKQQYSVVQYFAYTLYLPTLFLGPHITIYHFHKKPSHTVTQGHRLLNLLFELTRYLFWLFVIRLALHFIYVNALQLQIDFIEDLSGWTMNGLGYCMGQYFHLKYVAIYGITTCVARCENIDAPGVPTCVARVHKYSAMWRYFDRGLYHFLTRYLYHPWCSTNLLSPLCTKLSGSLLCFTFIWLWHGPSHLFVLVWAVLNFVGVSIEALCKEVNQMGVMKRIRTKLGPSNTERVEGVCATPLTILSIMSNIYFFGGMEVGNAYVRYILQGGWLYTVPFIYSLRHVSVTIEQREQKNAIPLDQQCPQVSVGKHRKHK
uniref:Protein-cysteine N-palmitoyltransferase Rasp n=1 Tax=Cacopsylla melanoneura TaxID=428564 RepID=A0A8D8Q6C4_9HEMI